MILTTTQDISDKKITKTFGLVKGNTIRARNIGRDIIAVLKNLVGGEIEEYTTLLARSREQALDRMVASAEELGANGISYGIFLARKYSGIGKCNRVCLCQDIRQYNSYIKTTTKY
jgi:uncharacterized protein YbjQ (UPF0145 family)